MDDSKRPNKKMFSFTSKPKPTSAPELANAPVEESDADAAKNVELDTDEDTKTDEAVEDIMKHDGDDALKAQDDVVKRAEAKASGKWARVKDFFGGWWANPRVRWISIGVIVVVLGVLAGIPYTRYTIAGVVVKTTMTVTVLDSKSGAPVSGATVQLGGQKAETNAKGVVALQVHPGNRKFVVTKGYYQSVSGEKLVKLSGNNFKTSLLALGHGVKVKVTNKITGKALADVDITFNKAHTKTDADGVASVVIPSSATTQEATLSLAGYNDAKVSISASGNLAKNSFSITPVGKLYFLSNLSGRIDVAKTDLDGSNREVVLEGTGTEDKYGTSLLASRDRNYLALLSKRANSQSASLYLIDTTNGDKLTTIDEGDANFSLVGWSGSRLIYQVNRHIADGQKNQEALKSFDATTGHTLLLDQTDGATYSAATGSGAYEGAYQPGFDTGGFVKQYFSGVYLLGDSVLYVKNWTSNGCHFASGKGLRPYVDGKSAEFSTIGADGSGHKTLKTFTPSAPLYCSSSYTSLEGVVLASRSYGVRTVYLSFTDAGATAYYKYEDGKLSELSESTDGALSATYLVSPSGNSTFWAEQRDGKSVLLLGNKDAKNEKIIANLSGYGAYGWFTDDYLLVTKNSSELYILPTTGGTPYKVTDYHNSFGS